MIFGTWIKGLAGMIANRVELATTPPPTEATVAVTGGGTRAARNDHRHERISSAQWGVTGSNGEATINLSRSYASKPTIDIAYEELADNPPCIPKVKTWITNANGEYVGVVVKLYRIQLLPSSLLSLSVLVNFNVTVNAPAGIAVSVITLQQST